MSEPVLPLLLDGRRATKQGAAAIAQRRRRRLADQVAFARRHAAFYREHYRGLPEQVKDPVCLPVTNNPGLMARFDDWVTDRAVTIAPLRAFVVTTRRASVSDSSAATRWPRPRARPAPDAHADHLWPVVQRELRQFLAGQQLGQVSVERAAEPPLPTAGGKYRTVIPLSRDGQAPSEGRDAR